MCTYQELTFRTLDQLLIIVDLALGLVTTDQDILIQQRSHKTQLNTEDLGGCMAHAAAASHDCVWQFQFSYISDSP